MNAAMQFENKEEFANKLDEEDALRQFRSKFHIPKGIRREEQIYFTGNSLGLQPRSAEKYLKQELEDWQQHGVEGHFAGKNPWFYYHHFFKAEAELVGALDHEVVVMNNLTVNLHLLFVSFYRPTESRYKIVMEAGAFPSDMYVVETQVRHHGYSYEDAVIEVSPRTGEYHLRTEDILQAISLAGDELALVFFSGVQYYTGQAFDIKAITGAAHEAGAKAGFDLAHAAGNLLLKLHDWKVDFAAWCTYKYLNSGPGGVSGVFIHEKHGLDPNTPRFAGWWGHLEKERFLMKRGYIPEPGAAGWQLSNAPVMTMAVHWASLEIFEKAGMEALNAKGLLLNAYLEFVVLETQKENDKLSFEIITPVDRGCQLSMLVNERGKELFDYLSAHDVVADWREPNVIRLAPVPLYNTFRDVYDFGKLLGSF
jgi:kynureninase